MNSKISRVLKNKRNELKNYKRLLEDWHKSLAEWHEELQQKEDFLNRVGEAMGIEEADFMCDECRCEAEAGIGLDDEVLAESSSETAQLEKMFELEDNRG